MSLLRHPAPEPGRSLDRAEPRAVFPAARAARRKRSLGRLVIAVACTLLLHGTLLALLFWRSGAAPQFSPQAPGPLSISVNLISLPPSLGRDASPPPDPQPDLDTLQRRLSQDGDAAAPPAPKPSQRADPSPLLKLFDDAKSRGAAATTAHPAGKPGGQGASWAVHVITDRYAMASVFNGNSFRTASPSLWPQISRCWRDPGQRPAVELQVTLDAHGAVVGVPMPLGKPAGDIGLTAGEAAARKAIIACAPYHLDGPDRVFAVRFGAGPDG